MHFAALWGEDHVALGEIAVRSAGPHAAVALTRGALPKRYHYVDPNEDVVAVVDGPRAALLVCADGHNGATASRLAVEEVLEGLGADPPAALDHDEWIDLFDRVNRSVLAARGGRSRRPSSRTVLLVALVAPGPPRTVSWAALGDAALVVAAPGGARGRQLNREISRYVGDPMSRRALGEVLQRGSAEIADGEWVVLATDGLSEFVAPLRPADAVPRALAGAAGGGRDAGAQAPTPAAAGAMSLVRAACDAGAGDNVGVALLAS